MNKETNIRFKEFIEDL